MLRESSAIEAAEGRLSRALQWKFFFPDKLSGPVNDAEDAPAQR
jgi:hypothetical protein